MLTENQSYGSMKPEINGKYTQFAENLTNSDDGFGRDWADRRAAPKGKRRTLRQKDRIPDETLESKDAPTKLNLSGTKTERMDIFRMPVRFSLLFIVRFVTITSNKEIYIFSNIRNVISDAF